MGRTAEPAAGGRGFRPLSSRPPPVAVSSAASLPSARPRPPWAPVRRCPTSMSSTSAQAQGRRRVKLLQADPDLHRQHVRSGRLCLEAARHPGPAAVLECCRTSIRPMASASKISDKVFGENTDGMELFVIGEHPGDRRQPRALRQSGSAFPITRRAIRRAPMT